MQKERERIGMYNKERKTRTRKKREKESITTNNKQQQPFSSLFTHAREREKKKIYHTVPDDLLDTTSQTVLR